MTGIDLNGRFGLRALDISETYDFAGELTSTRENVSVDDAHRRDAGVFAQIDAALGTRLTGAAGGRFDHVTTRNTGGYFGDRSTSSSAVSGFVSATAGPFNGITAVGQISRGFRDPVLSDRYFRGPSGRGFITGNPDLEPETSVQVDGAIRFTGPAVRLAVNAYRYAISGLIERYGSGDNFFFRNRGDALIRGLEAEAQATLPAQIVLELTAQIARGEDAASDAALDSIAPPTFSALGRRVFGTRGYAQARVAWFAEDDRPGPTERAVNGYTSVDVSGGVQLARRVELRAAARNLFDATYFASQDTRAVLAAGRSVSATIVIGY